MRRYGFQYRKFTLTNVARVSYWLNMAKAMKTARS